LVHAVADVYTRSTDADVRLFPCTDTPPPLSLSHEQLEKERPLIAKLAQHEFQTAQDGKSTKALMKRFAQKQQIRVSGSRQEVVTALLQAILTAPADRRWYDADEEVEEKSESEEENSQSEASSESEESDPEEWADMKIIYSMS
jgi:hypothetical protein